MQELDVPAVMPLRQGNLSALVTRNAAEAPDAVVYSKPAGDGWEDVTCREFAADVERLAKGLIAAGCQPGDRIALMSATRYEWVVCDFAIWSAGCVSVPVYETSSASQAQWILSDSGAVAAIVEKQEYASLISEVRDDLPELRDVWQIDGGGLDELGVSGSDVTEADLEARRASAGPDDLASVIYTSGSTGRPKGCELTHGNFNDLSANCVEHLEVILKKPGSALLLFLPLAHVFARFISIVTFDARVRVGHTSDLAHVLRDLGTFKPTFLLSVPRVFEKIYNSAEQTAQAGGKLKIFHWAARTAMAYSRAQMAGRIPFTLKVQRAVADKLVYSKLKAKMGGLVTHAISGGAPLGERLGHFYNGIGVMVLEGYGLTETTAPHCVNTPDDLRIGTVGRPIPGCAVRIAEDGEIMVRGSNVLHQYRNNPEATAEAFDGDWFGTGDLGNLDENGFLTITGRKKEIIVTAGGKNVAPSVLEDRLRSHPIVSQCIVVGDQKPYISALITLDPEMLPQWAQNKGIGNVSVAEAKDHPVVLEALQAAVDRANRAVSRAESIRSFSVLEDEWSVENGFLTPKQSLKRHVLLERYADLIEELYSRPRPEGAPEAVQAD